MAADRPLVGLDVGTTGVKAVAISPRGEVLGSAERGYALSTPQPGWAEQDPEDWWRASQAALADLGTDPAAIGLSGQMHGLVALDRSDRVLRPAILWNDQRTAAECAEIEERIGLDRLIELTGNRALTGFTAPKLLWLRRHEPETYARIAHILLPVPTATTKGVLVSPTVFGNVVLGPTAEDLSDKRDTSSTRSGIDALLEHAARLGERLQRLGANPVASPGCGIDDQQYPLDPPRRKLHRRRCAHAGSSAVRICIARLSAVNGF